MPGNTQARIRLFADNTIAYLTITFENDASQLQQDLDNLAEGEKTWQIEFHPEKCQGLRVTRNRKNIIHAQYTLHGHTLEIVDAAKYLGITITKDLNWATQVYNATKKANSTLGMG